MDMMKQKFSEIYKFKNKYTLHDLSRALSKTLDLEHLFMKEGKKLP